RRGGSPFTLIFQGDDHIAHIHRQRLCRHLTAPYFSDDLLNFGKTVLQNVDYFLGIFYRCVQVTSGKHPCFHSVIPLFNGGDEFPAHARKSENGKDKQTDSAEDDDPWNGQRPDQRTLIDPFGFLHHLIRKVGLQADLAAQENGAHHRDISEGEDESAQKRESYRLCHRLKHPAFNTFEGKDRQVDDQDDDLSEYGAVHHLRGGTPHLRIHFLAAKRIHSQQLARMTQ